LLQLLCALLGLSQSAQGIDPARAMSQYVRQRWGAESGFPRGAVYCITQTPDGYLWIGAEAGLVRFDGVNFQLMQDLSSSFKIASVLGLTADAGGDLWVRLQRPTMLRYRKGVFKNVMSEYGRPDSTVAAINRAQNGALMLWVLQGEGGALTVEGDRFKTLAQPGGLSRSPVLAITETTDGDVWIGTRDAGLYRLRNGQAEGVTKGLPDLKVNCLAPGKNGELWVGTDRGIARWDGVELTTVALPPALKELQALSLTIDRDLNLWVGTNSHGLLRINQQGVSSLSAAAYGAGEAVTAVFEDREGNLWIGSANGIERLRDSVFVSYSAPEGLPSEKNGPVFIDDEQRAWFAPLAGGLYWLNNGRVGRVAQAGMDKDIIYSIAGGGGDLWVGRRRGGLTRLRMRDGAVSDLTYTQRDGLAQDSVYAVSVSRAGDVWAGTLSGGVSKFSKGSFTTYTAVQGLASNSVSAIVEDAGGVIWFGTPLGLSALANGRWKTYLARDNLPSEAVNCLLVDSTKTLWIGTSGGLAFRKDARIERPRGTPSFLREPILGIAEDGAGALWIAASTHVVRVNRDRLIAGELSAADVREFGLADGLLGMEGVRRSRTVAASPSGQIWFSLNRGISFVDPSRVINNSAPAIAQLQSISADGLPISTSAAFRISADHQRIVFGFAGLSLAIPERVKFRFKLDSFDSEWSAPVPFREASYTNLPPGAYRFRVMASNVDGLWTGAEATADFQIIPLYWQTWWFRLCCVIVGLLGILALYRLRMLQLTRRMNLRFEERLAERTRIAQELHDTLLQGILSASMQLHVATSRAPADSAIKPMLERVLQLMSQVIDEGRGAIRGLRSTKGVSLDLEQAFSLIQDELGVQEPVGFRILVEGRPRTLHPILRDEVYRIGREALVNAFRHARARHIEVELDYAANTFRLLVRDDGCGIDPQVLQSGREGHWGLRGMRERAERIGARFRVHSRDDAGAEVELSIPGLIAYDRKPNDHPSNWFERMFFQKRPMKFLESRRRKD
jgi:signal transduction histidine kinase